MPSTPQTVDPAEVLDQIAARAEVERVLRGGDDYYATEAGAWDRDSADLALVDALVAALRAVLALASATDGQRHECDEDDVSCSACWGDDIRAAITSALGGAA